MGRKISCAGIFSQRTDRFLSHNQSWHEEIFAYFDEDCSYTNAAAEVTNSLIQRINAQRSGYGFNHLRAKAVYWHRSGARTAYRLDTKKKPIYMSSGTAETHETCRYFAFTTGFSHIDSLMPKIKGYKEYKFIVADEIITKRAPTSVFKYIDDSALYYDFPDEE